MANESRMRALFDGKWVLVTGASSGMGVEFARHTARFGAKLVLAARSEAKLEALAEELREAHGAEVIVVNSDLAVPGAAARLVGTLTDRGIALDHLINNAGVGRARPLQGDDPEMVGRLVTLNCTALTELTTALLPALVESGRGGILQVASMVGFYPSPFMSAYAASKAYVLSFTEALSVELKKTPLRLTALCPGHVPTGFQKAAGFGEEAMTLPGSLSAERTVALALGAYDRRKLVFVPGVVNWLGAALMRLLPRRWVARIAASTLKKMGRFVTN